MKSLNSIALDLFQAALNKAMVSAYSEDYKIRSSDYIVFDCMDNIESLFACLLSGSEHHVRCPQNQSNFFHRVAATGLYLLRHNLQYLRCDNNTRNKILKNIEHLLSSLNAQPLSYLFAIISNDNKWLKRTITEADSYSMKGERSVYFATLISTWAMIIGNKTPHEELTELLLNNLTNIDDQYLTNTHKWSGRVMLDSIKFDHDLSWLYDLITIRVGNID